MTTTIFSTIMGVSAFICFIALSYMILLPPKECEIIPGVNEVCLDR